jgi:flavin-dependent dehydrogenase
MSTQTEEHDVIVVGARVAGAATAMLLARAGHDVLVLERGRYGADTVSTHALMRAGVVQLRRWGLLDQLVAAATPAVQLTTFHYGNEAVPVPVQPGAGITALYAPRRTVLDPVLADAARDAGARVEYGSTVSTLVRDTDGRVRGVEGVTANGTPISARARLVVGADGTHSRVAREVGATPYLSARAASAFVYAYFTPLDVNGYDWFWAPGAAAGAIPTNDGTLVFAASATNPSLEPSFWSQLDVAAPHFVAQVRDAERTSRWHRWAGTLGYHRQSWGPGWALVGDAGQFKDPISAHGITDALRDAELLANAVDRGLRGALPLPTALRAYQESRDAIARPMFYVTDRLAAFDWDATEVRTLLLDLSRAMQAEMQVILALDDARAAA